MKLKINSDSPLYEALADLHQRGKVADDAATAFVKNRFGKELNFANPDGVLWGGMAAVQLKQAKKGWKQVNARYKLYAPTLLRDINATKALPVVLKQELKDILQYANYPCASGINTVPSVTMGDGYALVNVPDDVRGYEPLEAMVEILGSEFNLLFDLAEEWQKTAK